MSQWGDDNERALRAAREAVKDRVGLRGEQEEAGPVVRLCMELAALHDALHLVDGNVEIAGLALCEVPLDQVPLLEE